MPTRIKDDPERNAGNAAVTICRTNAYVIKMAELRSPSVPNDDPSNVGTGKSARVRAVRGVQTSSGGELVILVANIRSL